MRILLTLFLVLFAHAVHAERYALLIGINDYDRPTVRQGVVPLSFAAADAEALGTLLGNDYRVRILDNRNARAESIRQEFRYLRGVVQPEDSFLLFFAGHGVRDPSNDETYWLTYNTNLENIDQDGIRLSHLLDYVRDLKAGQKLVLLDHCFSGDVVESFAGAAGANPGPGGDGASSGDGSSRNGPVSGQAQRRIDTEQRRGVFPRVAIQEKLATEGQGLVVLAASSTEAFESPQLGHGVFTEALIRAFETHGADAGDMPDGQLSINELIDFVSGEVRDIANELGFQQEVIDMANAVNLAEWVIASLPPLSEDAAEKAEQYLDILQSWRNRPDGDDDWVTGLTITRCSTILQTWVESLENGTPLDRGRLEIKDKIVEYLEIFLEGDPLLEDSQIASNLEDEVNTLWDRLTPG